MKSKSIVMVIVLFILFSSVAVLFVGESSEAGEIAKKKFVIRDGVQYEVHDPIRINNDTDFANQAAAEGWPGSGTEADPYVISGYDIDAHGAGNAIYIGNTTVYFVIKNCILHNTSYHNWPYSEGAGLMLYNVKNGSILNTTCTDNILDGIYLSLASDNTIKNNTCIDKGDDIYLENSPNNKVYGNKLEDSGIVLGGNKDTFITQVIENNTVNGKPVYYYKNMNMDNASVTEDAGEIILGNVTWLKIESVNIDNSYMAIEIGYSSNITIRNITFTNDEYGIYLYTSTKVTIENITGYNTNNDIYLLSSNNNVVKNNTGYIHLHSSSYNNIENNTCNGGIVGIYLLSSNNNVVKNNTCNGGVNGIYIHSSNYNIVESNKITNNGGGISLLYSNYNIFKNNVFNENTGNGTYFKYSDYNIFENNTFNNNSWYGIYLWHSNHNTFKNNTYSNNTEDGILLWYSSNNLVTYNLISYNGEYGVCVWWGSSYNRIYNNSFYYNHGSGDSYDSSHVQAYDGGENNYWNSTTGYGNYWHDWANKNDSMDPDGDGIINWPYALDGSAGAKDYYPLAESSPSIPELSMLFFIILPLLIALLIKHKKAI